MLVPHYIQTFLDSTCTVHINGGPYSFHLLLHTFDLAFSFSLSFCFMRTVTITPIAPQLLVKSSPAASLCLRVCVCV